MPSKAAKKRKYYGAANKEKLNGYSKSYSKNMIERNTIYEEYYACDRDLSQKRSAVHATSRFTYHKDLEKSRADSTTHSKASYHRNIEQSQADSAAHSKVSYDKYLEASRLTKTERLFL